MTTSMNHSTQATFLQSQKAFSRWDNEGGAHPDEAETDLNTLTNVEMVHLRIRVIALENLVISLLAEGTDRQRDIAREMATFISPREGLTQHPLTIKAAEQMNDMVSRAEHFRTEP